jgi:aspartyl aminopeptidase
VTISFRREYQSLKGNNVPLTFPSFCAVEALTESVSAQSFSTLEGNVNCIALFNHEEIGSVSSSGAASSLIPSLLDRLSPTPATLAQSVSRSFLISADMGHAVHPNYTSKHQDNHKPQINGGIVIKTNAKQRYASDAIGTFLVKKLVERKGGKVQEFEVRNDMCVDSTKSQSYITDSFFRQGLRIDCWADPVQDWHTHSRCG